MKAKSAKNKGYRLEKLVSDDLNKDCHWKARRQPGSGRYLGYDHDNHAVSPTGKEYIFECKSYKDGAKTWDKAKGTAAFLVIKRDFAKEPNVYMTWTMFKDLCLDIYELHKEVEELKEKTNDTE